MVSIDCTRKVPKCAVNFTRGPHHFTATVGAQYSYIRLLITTNLYQAKRPQSSWRAEMVSIDCAEEASICAITFMFRDWFILRYI